MNFAGQPDISEVTLQYWVLFFLSHNLQRYDSTLLPENERS